MTRAGPLVFSLALLGAGCAGAPLALRGGEAAGDAEALAFADLQARLGARGAGWLGHAGEFRVGGERFNPDCTGLVEAVYEAEGIPLRALMQRAAPEERGGVKAAVRALGANGRLFGAGEWPAPGDLVFFHDTYDRNGNGRADDRYTHVGVVEYVVDGVVVFVHRGGRAVVRGAMDPSRPGTAAEGGVTVNTPVRARDPRLTGAPVLAGALFAGYGRIDPRLAPRRPPVAPGAPPGGAGLSASPRPAP